MQPRDWIIPLVTAWARQKRQIIFGHKDKHVEGFSELSIIGRVMEEGAGASHSSGRVFQWHPECYTGDGLVIQRALQRMPEWPRTVLIVHFVIDTEQIPAKIRALQTSRSNYYDALNCAYHYLAGRIDEQHESKVA